MQRISFTQTEVGMMNEIVDYLIKYADAMPRSDYIMSVAAEMIMAKGNMVKKLLNEGVLEK